MNTPNDSDVACASAAADLFEVPHQVTGSHLARVAQLFADNRCKAANERLARALERCDHLDAILGKLIAAQESTAHDFTEADWIEMRRALSGMEPLVRP